MHMPGIWGIVVISIVVVLLFGRGKISGLMGEVAGGIKAFKRGMQDEPLMLPADRERATDPADSPSLSAGARD